VASYSFSLYVYVFRFLLSWPPAAFRINNPISPLFGSIIEAQSMSRARIACGAYVIEVG